MLCLGVRLFFGVSSGVPKGFMENSLEYLGTQTMNPTLIFGFQLFRESGTPWNPDLWTLIEPPKHKRLVLVDFLILLYNGGGVPTPLLLSFTQRIINGG